MKALIYKGKNNINTGEIPTPDLPGRTGAIIKTIGCGLCGSDIVKVKKDLVKPGTVLGHELVGTIIDINTNLSSFKAGDRVAIAHHYPCYSCRFCDQKSYSMCETFKTSNFEPGGFAEFVYASDKHLKYNAVKIPDSISEIEASFMEPVACVLRAIDRLSPDKNQTILIIGLGFIGLLFLQVLKYKGIRVICADIDNTRLSIASDIGADSVLNPTNSALPNTADVAILCSGADASVDFAIKSVRDGGKIVIFSSVKNDLTSFSNNQIYYRELSIIGAYSASPEYFEPAMNFIQNNQLKLNNYCTIMLMDQINEAINKIERRETLKVYLKI